MRPFLLITLFIFYTGLISAQGKFFGGNGDGFATATISNIVLPVTIKNFEGWAWGNNTVKLTFSVSGDESVCGIIIERSRNGNMFAAVDTITDLLPAGFDEEFSRHDISPLPGNNYYRLHVLKCNGASVYSNIILISLPERRSIYYSAMDQKLYYHLQHSETLQIFNSVGQLVAKKILSEGTASITIDLPSAGIFFYKLSGGSAGKILK